MDTVGRDSFGVPMFVAATTGSVTAVVNVNAIPFPVACPLVIPNLGDKVAMTPLPTDVAVVHSVVGRIVARFKHRTQRVVGHDLPRRYNS
jgi:hypothetical protein